MSFADEDLMIHSFDHGRFLADVERTEESGDAVRYSGICLLAPGEWTDAASRTTIFYAPDAIQRSATNWVDNQVNLYHKPGDPIANVGHIDTDSVHTDDAGYLYADVVLHGRTSASQDAIGLMDLALETEGDQGMGGPSVEIPEDRTQWDEERGLERMVEMTFSGAALVMHPAAETVAFDQQFAERAVAMSADGSKRPVRFMFLEDREETTKTTAGERSGMGTSSSNEDNPLEQLRELQTRLTDLTRSLQDPAGDLLSAIEQYLAQDDASSDDPVSNLQAFIAEAGDEAAASALEAFIAEAGDDATVGDAQSWAEGQSEGGEEGDGEGEGEDEPPDETMQDEEGDEGEPSADDTGGAGIPDDKARAVVSALDDVASTVEAVQDVVEEEISSATNAVEEVSNELQADLSDVKERLSKLEENGEPKSLGGDTFTADSEFDDEELEHAAAIPTSDGRYFGR